MRDWKCIYCGTVQPGKAYRCPNCGAPKTKLDDGERPYYPLSYSSTSAVVSSVFWVPADVEYYTVTDNAF